MKPSQFLTWRKAAGLTQSAAALALGVSDKSVQRYETGRSPVPASVAAAVLGLAHLTNTEVLDADPVIIPATHPHLYDKKRGNRYERRPEHPGYKKGFKYKARVSELDTYIPAEPDLTNAEFQEQFEKRILSQPRKAQGTPYTPPAFKPPAIDPQWDDEDED